VGAAVGCVVSITDDEIERAVSSTTPTATAAPAPAVLDAMRLAIRAERRRYRVCRLGRALATGYMVVGATAGLVALALVVWR
jgi:hypothetical protein